MAELRLFPPLGGVSEEFGYSDQDPGTSRDMLNARVADPATGRIRLTRRSGMSKYLSAKLNAAGPVKELGQLVYNNLVIDYADRPNAEANVVEWGFKPPSNASPLPPQIAVSTTGDVFMLVAPANSWHRLNADGGLINSVGVPSSGARVLYVDALSRDVWIGIGDTTTGTDRILRYVLQPDDTYLLTWSIPNTLADYVQGLVVKHARLYTVQTDGPSTGTGTNNLRIYDNVYGPSAPTAATVDVVIAATSRPNGIDVNEVGEVFVVWTDNYPGGPPGQHLRKYDAKGTALWTVSASAKGGGIGSGVAVKGTQIATIGFSEAADLRWIAQWTDPGAVAPAAADWFATDAAALDSRFYRPMIDAFNNVHAPFPYSIAGATDEYQVFDSTGAMEFSRDITAPISAVALPPSDPVYSGSTVPPTRPERAYLAGAGAIAAPDFSLISLSLVSVVSKSGSTRAFKQYGQAGVDFRTFTTAAAATPTGGAGVFMADAKYVQTVTAFGKVYMTDGNTYSVYDPITDAVTPWVSTSPGGIPKHCQLVETWRGRMALSGDLSKRSAWYLSAAGNPDGWDFDPPLVTQKSAVAATSSPRIGEPPDMINAFAPYNDDLAVLGCDHSLYVIRGDPRDVGASLDTVSTTIGMSWGRPYVIAPDGLLYFWASRGGVFALNPWSEELVREIGRPSRGRIERQLQDVDLLNYYVRLAWDHENEGLIVLVIPFGAGGTVVKQFFWDQRADAWLPDQYGLVGTTTVQPTAITTIDGDDPDDRLVIVGCEDGHVRKLDKAAVTDDGVPIDFSALLGPLQSEERSREIWLEDLWAVLDSQLGPLAWEVFVADSPDLLPESPAASGVFHSGRNPSIDVRRGGAAVWVRLRSSDATLTASLESLMASVRVGPLVRTATF